MFKAGRGAVAEWVGTMGVLAESISAVSTSAASSAHQSSQSGEPFPTPGNIKKKNTTEESFFFLFFFSWKKMA